MSWRWFKGVIGGKPEKALYFIGRKEEDYIYLDPHYVQSANENISNNKNSYFCESFRKCKNTSIDPSLGICFYLPSLEDLNIFYQSIKKMKA
jgi:cysteine protease ATG4